MQANEFDKLAAFEGWYWWYRAQRANVVDAVRGLPVASGARILDAGCGTGRNLAALVGDNRAYAFGIDVSPRAASVWREGNATRCCQASINDLPYSDSTFDVVTSVDVLQEKSVDPKRSILEMSRVLCAGGHLILLAPAYQWMLSRHDRAVESVRRFTRGELMSLAESAGFVVESATYRFGLFFPAIVGKRLLDKLSSNKMHDTETSDLTPIPGWANSLLSSMARIEHKFARRVSLPFGSTVLLIARKGAK